MSTEQALRDALQNLHGRTCHMYGRGFPDMSKAIDDASAALALPAISAEPATGAAVEGGYPELPEATAEIYQAHWGLAVGWKYNAAKHMDAPNDEIAERGDLLTIRQARAFADAHLAAHRATLVAVQPSPSIPNNSLNEAIRAVVRNEGDVFKNADTLHAELAAAFPTQQPADTVSREDWDRQCADLAGARNLVTKVYNELPQDSPTRATIELGTGFWFCMGVNRHAAAIDKAREPSEAASPASVTDAPNYERMFNAACVDLGLINEALDLDPDDGGAGPIIAAIADLKRLAAPAEESREPVKGWSHWEGRIKTLMAQCGHPDSMSVLSAFKQLANEMSPASWGASSTDAPTGGGQEPAMWVLTERLKQRETTTRGYMWFTDPVNSAWTPLYTAAPQAVVQPPPDARTWGLNILAKAEHEARFRRESRDHAFEAVRKRFCALPRYSFLIGPEGGVRRDADRSGNWVDFASVHALFDPEMVDAALLAGSRPMDGEKGSDRG